MRSLDLSQDIPGRRDRRREWYASRYDGGQKTGGVHSGYREGQPVDNAK
jgi:hypothetical protein